MATLTSIINNIIQKVNNLTSSKVNKVTSTDNAVVRFNGNTGDVQNSGVIVDDNNNVGIGLGNPHAKLGVVHNETINTGANNNTVGSSIGIDSAIATQPLLGMRWTYNRAGIGGYNYSSQIVADSANNFALEMYTTGATPLILGTNSTERMRIDASGNVGIGVIPNAWYSTYKVNQLANASISGRTDANQTNVSNNWYVDTGAVNRYISNGYATRYAQDTGTHYWQTAPSGTAGNAITWNTAMVLGANGNLLIGTTTDNGVDKLQVNGSISSGTIQQISAGDLNDYKTRTQVIGTSNYVSNVPINDYGYLEVIVYSANDWVMQRFTTLGATDVTPGRIFVRCRVAGAWWSAWVEK